jgi:hypothetical protein
MLLPALGLLLSVAFFGTTGAVVLWFTRVRPLRIAVLAVFVLAAQAGLFAFVMAYGAVFADADNNLTSAGAVVGILLGMPVAGVVCGWIAARWFAARLARNDRIRRQLEERR